MIEVAELLEAMAGGGAAFPDFRVALAVQETIEAMQRASAARSWVSETTAGRASPSRESDIAP